MSETIFSEPPSPPRLVDLFLLTLPYPPPSVLMAYRQTTRVYEIHEEIDIHKVQQLAEASTRGERASISLNLTEGRETKNARTITFKEDPNAPPVKPVRKHLLVADIDLHDIDALDNNSTDYFIQLLNKPSPLPAEPSPTAHTPVTTPTRKSKEKQDYGINWIQAFNMVDPTEAKKKNSFEETEREKKISIGTIIDNIPHTEEKNCACRACRDAALPPQERLAIVRESPRKLPEEKAAPMVILDSSITMEDIFAGSHDDIVFNTSISLDDIFPNRHTDNYYYEDDEVMPPEVKELYEKKRESSESDRDMTLPLAKDDISIQHVFAAIEKSDDYYRDRPASAILKDLPPPSDISIDDIFSFSSQGKPAEKMRSPDIGESSSGCSEMDELPDDHSRLTISGIFPREDAHYGQSGPSQSNSSTKGPFIEETTIDMDAIFLHTEHHKRTCTCNACVGELLFIEKEVKQNVHEQLSPAITHIENPCDISIEEIFDGTKSDPGGEQKQSDDAKREGRRGTPRQLKKTGSAERLLLNEEDLPPKKEDEKEPPISKRRSYRKNNLSKTERKEDLPPSEISLNDIFTPNEKRLTTASIVLDTHQESRTIKCPPATAAYSEIEWSPANATFDSSYSHRTYLETPISPAEHQYNPMNMSFESNTTSRIEDTMSPSSDMPISDISLEDVFSPLASPLSSSRVDTSKYQPRTLERIKVQRSPQLPPTTAASFNLPPSNITVEEIFTTPTTKVVPDVPPPQKKTASWDEDIMRDIEYKKATKLCISDAPVQEFERPRSQIWTTVEPVVELIEKERQKASNTLPRVSHPSKHHNKQEAHTPEKMKRRSFRSSRGSWKIEHKLEKQHSLRERKKRFWRVDRVQKKEGIEDTQGGDVEVKPDHAERLSVSKVGINQESKSSTTIDVPGAARSQELRKEDMHIKVDVHREDSEGSLVVEKFHGEISIPSTSDVTKIILPLGKTDDLNEQRFVTSASVLLNSPNEKGNYVIEEGNGTIKITETLTNRTKKKRRRAASSRHRKTSEEGSDGSKHEEEEVLEVEINAEYFILRGSYQMIVHRSDPLGVLLESLSDGRSIAPAFLDFTLIPKLKRLLHNCMRRRSRSLSTSLSSRAMSILEGPDPAFENIKAAFRDLYHPITNPEGKVNLCTAENRVCEELIAKKIARISLPSDPPSILRYSTPGVGIASIRPLITRHLSIRFGFDLLEEELVVLPSLTTAYDLITHVVCDPHDIILTSSPLYARIINNCEDRCECAVKEVPLDLENPSLSIAAFEQQYAIWTAKGERVRAVIVTNPQNPLGCIFSRKEIIDLCIWADSNHLFVIFDEILAGTVFDSSASFQSILSFRDHLPNPQAIACLYSFSKDLGVPGLKVGFAVIPNDTIRLAVGRLESLAPVSVATQIMLQQLVQDADWLSSTLRVVSSRLRSHSSFLCSCLSDIFVPFVVPRAGLSIFADFSQYLRVISCEGEDEFWERCCGEGVVLTKGTSTRSSSPGWFRISFGCSAEELQLGVERIYRSIGWKKPLARRLIYEEEGYGRMGQDEGNRMGSTGRMRVVLKDERVPMREREDDGRVKMRAKEGRTRSEETRASWYVTNVASSA